MKKYLMKIDGMGCEKCVRKVTDALLATGAKVEVVSIGSAEVSFDGDVSVLKEAVEAKGFAVASVTEE